MKKNVGSFLVLKESDEISIEDMVFFYEKLKEVMKSNDFVGDAVIESLQNSRKFIYENTDLAHYKKFSSLKENKDNSFLAIPFGTNDDSFGVGIKKVNGKYKMRFVNLTNQVISINFNSKELLDNFMNDNYHLWIKKSANSVLNSFSSIFFNNKTDYEHAKKPEFIKSNYFESIMKTIKVCLLPEIQVLLNSNSKSKLLLKWNENGKRDISNREFKNILIDKYLEEANSKEKVSILMLKKQFNINIEIGDCVSEFIKNKDNKTAYKNAIVNRIELLIKNKDNLSIKSLKKLVLTPTLIEKMGRENRFVLNELYKSVTEIEKYGKKSIVLSEDLEKLDKARRKIHDYTVEKDDSLIFYFANSVLKKAYLKNVTNILELSNQGKRLKIHQKKILYEYLDEEIKVTEDRKIRAELRSMKDRLKLDWNGNKNSGIENIHEIQNPIQNESKKNITIK